MAVAEIRKRRYAKPTFGIINVITESVRKGVAADLAVVSPRNGTTFQEKANSTRTSGL